MRLILACLMLLASCRDRATWRGLPPQAVCSHQSNNLATCVNDGVIYTCVREHTTNTWMCGRGSATPPAEASK